MSDRCVCANAAVVLSMVALSASAAPGPPEVWAGPRIEFSKAPLADPTLEANQDRITPGVWITRGSFRGIYNAALEAAYTKNFSPAGTLWAHGKAEDWDQLTFNNWQTWHSSSPLSTLNTDAVVYLTAEDIYIDIKFTKWGVSFNGGGAFTYLRATPGCSISDFAAPVGVLDSLDIASFVAEYTAGGVAADVNCDGVHDFFDVMRFLQAFAAGCP